MPSRSLVNPSLRSELLSYSFFLALIAITFVV